MTYDFPVTLTEFAIVCKTIPKVSVGFIEKPSLVQYKEHQAHVTDVDVNGAICRKEPASL